MSPSFLSELATSRAQTLADRAAHPDLPTPATVDILALSGGGANGAYGAGFLYGWSQSNSRPEFRLVTGISTGALIAPFAFLGPAYDEKLKAAYTTTSTRDLLTPKDLFDIFQSDAATDNTPMANLIAQWIDADLLRAVAAQHARGRRLLVATVNLDAQRLVIWDMGAIASSPHPKALSLFRNVMRASASIPIVFPPLYLDVVAHGQKFDELHVDGGTVSQTFLWDASISLADQLKNANATATLAPVRLFIIRNAPLRPQFKEVRPLLREIGPRAIDTLLSSQGLGDLYRLYATCQRDHIDYNVAYIPSSFDLKPKEAFDRHYMSALFELGRSQAAQSYPWAKSPFALQSASFPATAP